MIYNSNFVDFQQETIHILRKISFRLLKTIYLKTQIKV